MEIFPQAVVEGELIYIIDKRRTSRDSSMPLVLYRQRTGPASNLFSSLGWQFYQEVLMYEPNKRMGETLTLRHVSV